MAVTAAAPKATAAQLASLAMKEEVAKLEGQITDPMLIDENNDARATFESVERFYNSYASGFKQSYDGMVKFYKDVEIRNGLLQNGNLSKIPSPEELAKEDNDYRGQYFQFFDTTFKLSAFVNSLIGRAASLRPAAVRVIPQLPDAPQQNPIWRDQIRVLDTIAGKRAKVASDYLLEADSLYNRMLADLQKTRDRVGEFEKLKDNNGRPISMAHNLLYSYKVARPDVAATKAVTSSCSSSSSSSSAAAIPASSSASVPIPAAKEGVAPSSDASTPAPVSTAASSSTPAASQALPFTESEDHGPAEVISNSTKAEESTSSSKKKKKNKESGEVATAPAAASAPAKVDASKPSTPVVAQKGNSVSFAAAAASAKQKPNNNKK